MGKKAIIFLLVGLTLASVHLVKAQQPPVAQQDLDRGGARLRRSLPLMAAVVPSTP